MDADAINLSDIKKMRLERHWSQDQLAEMSGLSIRTIQRIEKGENAGLESLKALAAVFEITIADPDKAEAIEQVRKEEEYVQRLKGFYKLLGLAIISTIVFLVLAIFNPEGWFLFFYMLIYWALFLGIYSLNYFDFFGEEWKRKMIDKKFNKK